MNVYTLKGVVPDYFQAGYVLVDKGSALCVDCAFDPSVLRALLKEQNATLHGFLLTHCHFDHVWNADVLPREFGVKLYASPLTQALLDDGSWLGNVDKEFHVDETLQDGPKLNLGGFEIEVIATPGHTADGLCFLVDGQYLFTGDTVLPPYVGRTDLPTGDEIALKASCQKLWRLPDDTVIYPGHVYRFDDQPKLVKPRHTVGREKVTNVINKR